MIKEILRRWKKAEQDKSRWHDHYDDLARVMLPNRLGFSETAEPGGRRTEDLFDSTPLIAARGLANSIGGLIRPKSIPEINMESDATGEGKDWMEDSEERLRDAFNDPHSRFLQASGEVDFDLITFGTAVGFTGETMARDGLLFKSIHLKDATPYFNDDGVADGMFREKRITVREAAKRFDVKKLSENTQNKLKESPESIIRLLHAVLPREDGREDALFAKKLPYTDLWIEIEEKHKAHEGGFHEFPFFVPRWDTSSGENMGRSPGMIALPDSDTLQAMGETLLIAGQRAADPPLAAPNDGSFSAVNTYPGGLSYYDVDTAMALRGNPFYELGGGANLPITRDMQDDTRQQIYAAFFRNVLNLPVEGPQMTAYEVNQRKEEFIREIGPIFGRLETDYTAPMVERAFMLMLRAGKFLPIPQELQGQNIKFSYDSPTKRIRKQIEAAAARMWAQEQLVLSEVEPEAKDLINFDELGRFSAEAGGVPNKIINNEDEVKKIRQARQQAIAEQQQMEQLQKGAEIAKVGAEAADKAGLTQTD